MQYIELNHTTKLLKYTGSQFPVILTLTTVIRIARVSQSVEFRSISNYDQSFVKPTSQSPSNSHKRVKDTEEHLTAQALILKNYNVRGVSKGV